MCVPGCVTVLQTDGTAFALVEKDLPAKLELLFRKSLYGIAISLIQAEGGTDAAVAEVRRRLADHLYAKQDYDGAMAQYVQTIGCVYVFGWWCRRAAPCFVCIHVHSCTSVSCSGLYPGAGLLVTEAVSARASSVVACVLVVSVDRIRFELTCAYAKPCAGSWSRRTSCASSLTRGASTTSRPSSRRSTRWARQRRTTRRCCSTATPS